MALPAIDPDLLPKLEDNKPKRNLFAAGLSAGVDELQGLLGSATEFAGRGLGIKSVEDYGAGVAARNAVESQQNGRPDLEIAPWHAGGASVLPWLAYQTTKQLPQLAGYLGAAALVPEAAVPAGLARLGAVAPRLLGGAGLEAGAGFAARRAAVEAGNTFGKRVVAAEVAGIPLAAGSMYQEAKTAHPEGVSGKDLATIALASPLYAAVDSLDIPLLSGLKNLSGNVIKKTIKGGLVGAGEELVQEGVQTAMEQSFRTDLSPRDKMANIVEGAVTGAAVGGVLGGAASIRRVKTADPSTMSNDTLSNVVNEALGLPAPGAATDSGGRTVIGSNALDTLQATPVDVGMSPTDQMVASFNPTAQPAIESQTIIQGKQGSIRHAQPLQTEEQRPFGSAPQSELETHAQVMANYLGKHEGTDEASSDRYQKVLEQYQLVADELNHRDVNSSATNDNIPSQVAGAVDSGSDVSGGAATTNSRSPAPATFNKDELLKGISTRKVYAGATNLDELKSSLVARLDEGSTAKGDLKLAERLGIDLNEPAKVATEEARATGQTGTATSVATQQEATTAPAAPANEGGGDQSVDTDFQKEWGNALKKRRGEAVQSLRQNLASNREQALGQLYDALGATGEDTKVDGYKGVTKLAEDFGLLTKEGQLTDEGVRIARTRIPLEDTVKEAVGRGYSGTEASAFDRGARGDRNVKLGSIAELKAFNDGQEWATNRRAKSAPIPNTAGDTETERVVDNARTAVTSADIPEKQRNMQFLNQAVDQVYGATVRPAQQAQLKRMVRDGATAQELDEAAKKMAGGEVLNPSEPAKPYRGETVTPSVNLRTRIEARKQEAREDLESRLSKPERMAASKKAIETHLQTKQLLRQEIDEAFASEDITGLERIGLIAELHRNNLEGVKDRLPGGDKFRSKAMRADRRAFLGGVAATAIVGMAPKVSARPAVTTEPSTTLRGHIEGGDIVGALQHIKANSPHSIYRTIAAKLLRGADYSNVTLRALPYLNGMLGATQANDDGTLDVSLFGDRGVNEETFLHEMIHAYAWQRWATLGLYNPLNKALVGDTKDRGDAAVIAFNNLWDHIGDALKKTNPELLSSEDEKDIWASESYGTPDEMLSWVLTDPNAQMYLRNVDVDGKPIAKNGEESLWTKLVNWFASILRLPQVGPTRNALDHILSAGFAVLDAGANVAPNNLYWKMKAEQSVHDDGLEHMKTNSVLGTEGLAMRAGMKSVIEQSEKVDFNSLKGKLRQVALGWMSLHGANELYGKWFDRNDGKGSVVANGAKQYEHALGEKNAIVARMAQMLTDVRDAYGALERTNADSARTIVQLMQMSEFGINPTKPWKEQSQKLRDSRNAKNLERLTNQSHDLYRKLLSRGHANVYQNMRDVNDVLMIATLGVSLHQHVEADGYAKGKMAEFGENPMDEFMREQATKQFSPADARKWWSDRVTGQITATYGFLDSQRTIREAPDTDAGAKEALKTHIDDLGKRAHDIQETMRQLEDAPYFHLGRYGNFFIGWRVPNSEAMAKVADRLADLGFNGVINDGTDKLRVYMRVESRVAQKNLDAAVRKLMDEGLVEPETIRTGQRTKDNFTGGFQPQWVNQMIASIEESDIPEEDKEMQVNALRGYSVDLTPEMSLARVMTHREGIPGYSPDMMRSFDWRAQVGINALAGMVTSPKITQSFVDMRGALNDAEKGSNDDFPLEQRNGMRDIVDEYSRRERERATWPETHLIDQIKGISTAWFLGFSPSYGLVNMTQLGATLWPELGAKHGFVEAAKAISKATPIALKIMKEVARHGYKVSLDRSMDAVITQDVLRKTVGKEMAEFLMRVVNTGNLDIGGPSRELIRSAEGSGDNKVDRVLRYASSIGYYTETASRLIAAIATKQLNPKLSVEKAADHAAYILNETMWNYARTNQGREFGKMGILGRYTPLATQFLQFQAQLTEKLFRETYTAIKGDTKAEQTEARRYLKGHLTAMTFLAGSLGLPMATVVATAIDRLKDLWDDDDEPSNVKASYRNWLADVLGKDAGEVIAHGVGRAAGFDISQRIGEQDIFPFSRFLADRRKFKDSIPDLAMHTWGAPTSIMTNFLEGGEAISDGNIQGGMAKMLPNAFSAPVKAYNLTEDGYVDTAGKKLPMTPGARDILVQLLGLNPSAKAEYSETRQDQAMRKGILTRDASALRDQIANAVVSGDEDTARQLIARAQEFDNANPAFAVLPRLGESIRRRSKVQAVAQATGTPLGVSVKDLEGQQLTRYANY